jgi:hypothetical protein
MGKNQSASNLVNIIQTNNGNISFISGSTTLMQISSSGAITTTGVISGSNALSASYAVSASNALNAITASFVANAQSASNAVTAQTASFANTFTVNSTLTAQTLVVQTITSSVDYVTGSTRFGSLLDNTHIFTGSIDTSGSINFTNTLSLRGNTILDYDDNASSPRLGIGFAPQSFAKAVIADNSTGYGLFVRQNNSSGKIADFNDPSGNSVLSILANGNIGIGITNPSHSLHISLNSNTGSSVNHLYLYNPTSGTNQTAGIRLGTSSDWKIQLRTAENQDWLQITDNGGTVRHGWYAERYYPGASSLNNSGTGYISGNGTGIGIGTATIAEGTQSASSISIFPSSSVSSGPLIQFAGNGRIRPASTGDRLSIDGNALYLNSYIGGTIIANSAGGNFGIGTTNPTSKLQIGTITATGVGTSSPTCVTLDDTFGTNTIGTNFKLKIFQDNATNRYGFGVSDNLLEIVAGTNGAMGFYVNQSTRAMTINSSGYLLTPLQPAFYAYGSGAGATSTTGVYGFNATRLNRGGHFNTTNGRFTAPIAGVYRFLFASLYRQKSGTSSGEISIAINGSNVGSRGLGYALATNSTDTHVPTTAELIYSLSAGDYVMPFIYSCGAGSDWYMDSNLAYFCGYLIG